jgi:hypothetical protein
VPTSQGAIASAIMGPFETAPRHRPLDVIASVADGRHVWALLLVSPGIRNLEVVSKQRTPAMVRAPGRQRPPRVDAFGAGLLQQEGTCG